MSITAGSDIVASDFINDSERNATPANDAGRVPKLETDAQLSRHFIKKHLSFGGSGADGALSITSGTTTVDLGGAQFYVLNYLSISITGTGKLAFSNPHANGTVVLIQCLGNCTLTSSAAPMIDLENVGAAAGTGGSRSSGPANTKGSVGNNGKCYGFIETQAGTTDGEDGGSAGTFGYMGGINELHQIVGQYPKLFVGAGGGGGTATVTSGSGTTTGGDGGRGGGCLIMQIAGAMNFTTANGISVAGQNGQNGVAAGASTCNGGGGGGGGAGSAFIFYNTLTAFSGTVKVSGGVGGNAIVAGSGNGSGGGAGGSALNTGANAGTTNVNGNKNGGDGGAGLEVHGLNYVFA